jgi:hypothetical protein
MATPTQHRIQHLGYVPEERKVKQILDNMEKEKLFVSIQRDGHEFHISCDQMKFSNATGLLAETLTSLLDEWIELTS